MSRRAITLTAIAVAFVALVLTIIVSSCSQEEPMPTPPDTPSSATDQPTAVFIGDSYTVGAGTSLEGTGYPSILGEMRGWDVVNLAISGTGYSAAPDYASIVPAAVAEGPEIAVVAGGRNDLLFSTPEELRPAVADFYTRLREALPEARIIATSPLWHDETPPQALIDLGEIVQLEAERVDAEFLDLDHLFEDRSDLIRGDGMHPNEAGLQAIADRINELLPDADD